MSLLLLFLLILLLLLDLYLLHVPLIRMLCPSHLMMTASLRRAAIAIVMASSGAGCEGLAVPVMGKGACEATRSSCRPAHIVTTKRVFEKG